MHFLEDSVATLINAPSVTISRVQYCLLSSHSLWFPARTRVVARSVIGRHKDDLGRASLLPLSLTSAHC